MTTFTALSDATLSQDKPFTQDIARAMRDNPLAQGEGDPTAPPILAKAIESRYIHVRQNSDYPSGTFLGSSGFGTKVQFTTEIADPANLYSQSTHRFTPNMAGLYRVCFSASLARNSSTGAATTVSASFFLNGSSAASGVIANPSATASAVLIGYTGEFETFISMNGTTDYIEVYCADASGFGLIKAANFTAHLISRA